MNVPFFVDSLPDSPLEVWDLAVGSIGRPAGHFEFAFPRLYGAADGTLLALWGERASRDSLPFYRAEMTQLWASEYQRARGWSTPRLVADSATILWDDVNAGTYMDSAAAVHVVVPALWSFLRHGLLDVSYAHGSWSSVRIPMDEPVASVSVARLGSGTLLLAMIRALGPLFLPNRSVVLVSRSDDEGRTWQHPDVVLDSPRGLATEIWALAADSSSVHLLWGQNLSAAHFPEVIRHLYSVDGGRSFSAPEDFRPADGFDGVRPAIDGCGALHVVYQHRRTDTAGGLAVHVDEVTWNGTWSEPQHLFQDQIAVSPGLFFDPDSSLLRLVWSARPSASARFAPLTTFVSEKLVRR